MSQTVKDLRRKHPDSVFVNAGDFYQVGAKARKRFLFKTATQPGSSFLGTAMLVRTKKAGTA